ncbi:MULTISPECIES: ubiquinol-cytochrome C chaperone family protein [unclassified Phenylobacterium]|uniref:ubiquinol-cytochrome C chaperone family protein n=1 Tax=unclassified Phenylobacterium TaxID=2640670 RepID=UPI0022B46F13|nr:ubiquinol-cytochrome C chaperone family protein [Phenylobacterium sp. NIBR 498073]MBS0489108.1 ubiquinol-cytochrome C reductase [Pseudomonadota bacterium]WGU38473.1 ubiquinol-cytochrome C chaperone family protein [Phenylobacterium sp. NIBR 498073]
MFLDRFFRPRATLAMGQKLYAGVVAQARTPALYEAYGVPDTVEGRFELYTVHVFLLLDRLRGQGARASETSQALFDTYLGALDDALREMGVGDLSVGKKMRKLGEAFYGRVKSYESAFAALPQTDHLHALLGRTVYAQGGAEHVAELGEYVLRQRAALAEQKLEGLLDGRANWSAA